MKSALLSIVGSIANKLPTPARKFFFRLRPITKWVRKILNRAAPVGLTVVEVAAGELTGSRMELDLQAEKDYWLGTYEVELQAAIRELVKPGWVTYDVGANIGYISLLLSRAIGATGKVFSFEALPANVSRLNKNVQLNGLEDVIEVVPAAVTSEEGKTKFLVGPSVRMGKAAGSMGRDLEYAGEIEVESVSLDGFMAKGNPAPQLIKMDIEGGEVMALPGMRGLLMEQRPVVLLELHGREAADAAWDCFVETRYTIHQMRRGYPIIRARGDLDWKAYIVAVPENAETHDY